MKKIYAAVALAMVVSAGASAKNFDVQNMPAQPASAKQIVAVPEEAVPSQDTDMKKKCNFKSVEDLYGYYRYMYYMGLKGYEGIQRGTIEIMPSDKDGYVNMVGFFGYYPVEAKVDVANQTLTISRQEAFYNTYYKKQIYYQPANWDDDNNINFVDSIVLRYNANGESDADGNVYYKGWITYEQPNDCLTLPYIENDTVEGWFGIMYYNLVYDMSYYLEGSEMADYLGGDVFVYNESEWKDAGTANFTDGFLSPIFSQAPGAYSVPVKTKISNPNLVLLVDPFGKNSPYAEYNDSEEEGYIMLNIANPECVKVIPFVYSGYSEDTYWRIFFTNLASYYAYFQDYDDEDVVAVLENYGYDAPSMDDNKVVKIADGKYCTNYDLVSFSDWTSYDDDDNEIVYYGESTIELPANVGGVEGILDDASNAPVSYYNLQGVKVANPVKGDLVIAKQGSKATKVIVK